MAANDTKTPNFDDDLRIALQFPRPFFEAWEEEAEKSLKGRSLSSLEVTTHEGLVVKPLYTPEDIPFNTPGISLSDRSPRSQRNDREDR